MSTALIANRAPRAGTVAGVKESVRFSVRDTTGNEIVRDTINFYVGSGPAFYKGWVLPEEYEDVTFDFTSLYDNETEDAVRSIELDGALKIVKGSAGTTMRGTYEFGKLQSPADPEDALMAEFTLKLAEADVVSDGFDFTGVLFGLKINGVGIHVKFMYNGVEKYIDIHSAELASVDPVTPTYRAIHDWDQAKAQTYKVLWHPKSDALRLYVSSGDDEVSDILLIDGFVSDVPPLPPSEVPDHQPMAYFGHGYPNSESISYWYDAYLFNLVHTPVVAGLNRGEHVGFIRSDDTVIYIPEVLPEDADRPWNPLPDSFGTIEGFAEVSTDKRLLMTRSNLGASFGYYRREVLDALATVFDFRISGRLLFLDPANGQATGMEVYIDDGVKMAVVALLDADGTQSIGLLGTSLPAIATSYLAQQASWLNDASYRLIFDPSGVVTLKRMIPTDEGVDEEQVASLPYASLPDSGRPGPGLGFLHNANVIEAKALLRVARARYSSNVRQWSGSGEPSSPWVKVGTGGSVGVVGAVFNIDHFTTGDTLYYQRPEPNIDAENGFFMEFRARVNSYEVGGEVNPSRALTGAGIVLDDGTYRHQLMFADAGGELGQIIFLATDDDLEDNLFDIRAGKESVMGTYAQVEWSKLHLYRLERTIGDRVLLFIDEADEPSIEFSYVDFVPAPTEVPETLRFGSLLSDRKSNSDWQFVRHGSSRGLDIAAYPVLSENEVLARFDHAFNAIAEAANSQNAVFTGIPGEFHTSAVEEEDFEDEWPGAGPLNLVFSGVAGLFD